MHKKLCYTNFCFRYRQERKRVDSMSTLIWVMLITLISGVGGTGLGGLVSAFIRKDSKRIVSLLLSFAAGVMLAVVCFDLLADALHEPQLAGSVAWSLLGIVLGYAVVALLNHLIDQTTNHEVEHIDPDHPKTADDLDELIHSDHFEEHKKDHNNLFIAGIIMAAAIALHNLPEGMVIGSAYAGSVASNLFTSGGFLIAVVIGLHNIPEGMAVAVPLIAGGMGRVRAVCVTALSGLPTVIGALLGYWLGSIGPLWHTLSLAFASGAMLYVVFGELLPESILMWRSKLPSLAAIIGILVGIFIIFA